MELKKIGVWINCYTISHAIHAINDISPNLDHDICESWQLM